MHMSSITTSFVMECTYGRLRRCTKNTAGRNLVKKCFSRVLKISTGQIVRINPRELHIKDPYFYDEIYAPSSRKREKDPKFVTVFGFPNSLVATVGHDLHRFRRGLLNSYFSKKSILELSPLMHEQESKLMQRFEKANQDNTVVQLDDAFAAFTADLISQYSWGENFGFLDDEHFNSSVREAVNEASAFIHVYKFFPILGIIVRVMPRRLLSRLKPGAASILDMQHMVAQKSTAEKKPAKNFEKTIFHALNDLSVPPKERSPGRIEDEAMMLILGGTETTARALTVAAFYLYQNKPLIVKLRKELRPIMPTPVTEASWTQLEQLPYLVCCLVPIFGLRANQSNYIKITLCIERCCI